MAYDRLEPFGEERADLRAGIVASTVATGFHGGKRLFRPREFMPEFDYRLPDEDELAEQVRAGLMMFPREDV